MRFRSEQGLSIGKNAQSRWSRELGVPYAPSTIAIRLGLRYVKDFILISGQLGLAKSTEAHKVRVRHGTIDLKSDGSCCGDVERVEEQTSTSEKGIDHRRPCKRGDACLPVTGPARSGVPQGLLSATEGQQETSGLWMSLHESARTALALARHRVCITVALLYSHSFTSH